MSSVIWFQGATIFIFALTTISICPLHGRLPNIFDASLQEQSLQQEQRSFSNSDTFLKDEFYQAVFSKNIYYVLVIDKVYF